VVDNKVDVMTFSQLKKIMEELEANEAVTDDTKVFIDTGWDSVQEVDPNAFHVEEVVEFKVQDELTKEFYVGFSLTEKAERTNAQGQVETAVIIRNLY
jgi:acyl carrier protein